MPKVPSLLMRLILVRRINLASTSSATIVSHTYNMLAFVGESGESETETEADADEPTSSRVRINSLLLFL